MDQLCLFSKAGFQGAIHLQKNTNIQGNKNFRMK